MKDIEKNNKIIAEFMEYTNNYWYQNNELKYHSSWDWLMPVAIRCVNINLNEYLIKDKEGFMNVLDSDYYISANPIEFLYEKVVEFITWYNKN